MSHEVSVFVSRSCYPANDDDQMLIDALERKGCTANAIVWDEATAGSLGSIGVIRSTWDYAWKLDEYRAWLTEIADDLTLLNPLDTLLWSLDKSYLAQLEARGVPVIPSRYFDSPSSHAILSAAESEGWSDVVLKSTVSAGGRQMHRVSQLLETDVQVALDHIGTRLPVILQPFIPGISSGEYSLIYLAGSLSHTVLKTPAVGEYRVQDHYGGSVMVATPPAPVVDAADAAIAAVGLPWLYARVDVVEDEASGPLIVEVEMVEPDLFLRFGPGSADVLASGLARWVSNA